MRCAPIILILAELVGCAESATTEDQPAEAPATTQTRNASEDAPTMPESIGSARLEEDGTLVLKLRAEGPGGLIGDALQTIKPSDPDYQSTLEHIGGLEPGQSKPVPPWPDDSK